MIKVKYVESNPVRKEFVALEKKMLLHYEIIVQETIKHHRDICIIMTPIMQQRFDAFWAKYGALRQTMKDVDDFKAAVEIEIGNLEGFIASGGYNR